MAAAQTSCGLHEFCFGRLYFDAAITGACSNCMTTPSESSSKRSAMVERFSIELADKPMSVASLAAYNILQPVSAWFYATPPTHTALLSHGQPCNRGLGLLAHLPHLNSLSLDNYLTDVGIKAISASIKTITGLQQVDVSGNAMGDEAAWRLLML